jgi:hypothetical protein
MAVTLELLSTLSNTNSTLTGQLAAKDKVIAALQAQLFNSNSNNTPAPAPAHHQVSASDEKKRYCWTHGIRVSSNHDSANCRTLGEGRKGEATRDKNISGKYVLQGGQVEDSDIKDNIANNLNYYETPVAQRKSAILDSGCSSHYLKPGSYCINMR